MLGESNRKPNKIWVGKGSDFYNRSMNSWLEKNHRNEGKFIAEIFFRTLKNKISKYVTSVSKMHILIT